MNRTITTDPIADMLARIRNALAAQKSQINVPYSHMKAAVAQLLKECGFIVDTNVSGEGVDKSLTLTLTDGSSQTHRITAIDRVSKPGRRYYVSAQEIPIVKRGRGIVIISTSKGLMTGEMAKTHHIGGELICKVY
jgi:small subunit ribosomal protein S8